MATHAPRLARIFTPEYASRINAQLVHPARSQVVKPRELESALARPLHVVYYEPERTGTYLAVTLSYGIIKGHPFMDGNKRTAFFLANEYLKAQGLPALVEGEKVDIIDLAERQIRVACGTLDVEGLATRWHTISRHQETE